MIKNLLPVIIITALLSNCSTVTIHPEPSEKKVSPPTYQETKNFYFAGLVGVNRVNVKEICGDRKVTQMQSQASAKNSVLSLLTLGIYTPHTVKVWCE